MEEIGYQYRLYPLRVRAKLLWLDVALALVLSLCFLGSSHSPEDIAIAIVVPLTLFSFPIYVWNSISYWRTGKLPTIRTGDPNAFRALPLKRKIIAILVLLILLVFIACFFGAIAIYLASFTYNFLGVAWAIIPARRLSVILLEVSLLPVLFLTGLAVGISVSGKIRDPFWSWVSSKAIQVLTDPRSPA